MSTDGDRHEEPVEASSEGSMPWQLGELLRHESTWLQLWRQLTRRTGVPRPPFLVPEGHREELLRALPDLVMEVSYLGYPAVTADVFGLFYRTATQEQARLLVSLEFGQLHPQVVRMCLTRAQIRALRDPDSAQDLVQLARLLSTELEDCPPHVEPLDEILRVGELAALLAEVESVAARVSALQGSPEAARRALESARSILDTPADLVEAARKPDGRLPKLEGVARFALRGHGRWLASSSVLEASLGRLDVALSHARDGVEMYLQARDYFLAGLECAQAARYLGWQARPEAAVDELERALQLMDVRTSPRLHGRLLVELAFLYFETGAAVRGNEEVDVARALHQVQESDAHAARGWLFVVTGEVKEGVRWLRRARAAALPGAVRSAQVLTLDLVEAELALPFPREDPARWLEDETSSAGMVERPAALQVRWEHLASRVRAGVVATEEVRRLRADVQRAEVMSRCGWVEG